MLKIRMPMCRQELKGFTLIELITVMLVLGILSTFAASRFFSRSAFDEAGFTQESLSAVRYAQKLAIASGCDIRITFTVNSIALEQWIDSGNNSCDVNAPAPVITPVAKPGGGNFTIQAPNNVTVTASLAVFYFDQIGIPFSTAGVKLAAETTVTIGANTFSIAPETGFVRCTIAC
jgi:prepilin-type N-terminal cleavage/methylation domain-containing protein